VTVALGLAALAAWLLLLFGRAGFWRARDDDADAVDLPEPPAWPDVVVLVPARDEAATIATTVRSLLRQDYAGALRLVVIDDRSTDGTGGIAQAAAAGDERLTVVTGVARPAGWAGKLWALEQGLAAAPPAPLLLFTDADIEHAPDSLRRLVQRQRAGRYVMVSLMARLRCESRAERWLIPAFVFFFQLLYPFARVRDPASGVAAAAGGCMLLDRAAFAAAGGLAPIRAALIDDCSLARQLKRKGPIWLGLTERVVSRRAYGGVAPIRAMVVRSAYEQLGRSPMMLAGMLIGLALVFLVPPGLALFADGVAGWLGAAAWGAMIVAYGPTLCRFGLSRGRGFTLPLVAAAYMSFTVQSAIASWRGRGGLWKGEYAPLPKQGT